MLLFGTELCLGVHQAPIANILNYNYKLAASRHMIRQILAKTNNRRELYKNNLVCGCLYRSFNDFQAGVFFRFAAQNRKMGRQNIGEIDDDRNSNKNYKSKQKVSSIVDNFKALNILNSEFGGNGYYLNSEFVKNVEQFIKQQKIRQPVAFPNKPAPYEPKPYEFLEMLLQGKLPSKCKIAGVSPGATALTKDQFMYIKSDISYKIGVLIDGIISGSNNLKNIQTLVMLNLLDSDQYYLRDEKINPVLEELASIKLVQIAGDKKQYFRISKYLEHFTFKNAKERQINTKLNVRIIIETNFKVFAVIKSYEHRENKVIKKILSMLLKSDNEGVEYEELFIGEINMLFMKQVIFRRTGITTSEYFDFFKQYTDEIQAVQKDLGKWNKLKFIGLEGPSEESNIPSNIKQEVKLWEHLKDSKDQDI